MERYGENPTTFACQLRVSFRLDPAHVYECR
jgi:hypothetical protein